MGVDPILNGLKMVLLQVSTPFPTPFWRPRSSTCAIQTFAGGSFCFAKIGRNPARHRKTDRGLGTIRPGCTSACTRILPTSRLDTTTSPNGSARRPGKSPFPPAPTLPSATSSWSMPTGGSALPSPCSSSTFRPVRAYWGQAGSCSLQFTTGSGDGGRLPVGDRMGPTWWMCRSAPMTAAETFFPFLSFFFFYSYKFYPYECSILLLNPYIILILCPFHIPSFLLRHL